MKISCWKNIIFVLKKILKRFSSLQNFKKKLTPLRKKFLKKNFTTFVQTNNIIKCSRSCRRECTRVCMVTRRQGRERMSSLESYGDFRLWFFLKIKGIQRWQSVACACANGMGRTCETKNRHSFFVTDAFEWLFMCF